MVSCWIFHVNMYVHLDSSNHVTYLMYMALSFKGQVSHLHPICPFFIFDSTKYWTKFVRSYHKKYNYNRIGKLVWVFKNLLGNIKILNLVFIAITHLHRLFLCWHLQLSVIIHFRLAGINGNNDLWLPVFSYSQLKDCMVRDSCAQFTSFMKLYSEQLNGAFQVSPV